MGFPGVDAPQDCPKRADEGSACLLRRYETRSGIVTMRPEQPDDDAFLFALFRSHTERPLRQGGLADAAIETVVVFQYRSQTVNNRARFPNAAFSIIESEGRPIGRLIEQDEGETVYFVDFALLPERQAKGLGTAYIEMVADEWARRGRAARVEVRYGNAHSLKLCRNLGFVLIEDKGMGFVNLVRPVDPALRAGA
jgi:GNAT superfamily N-acetyltransferase